MKYGFIQAYKDVFPVRRMCSVLGVKPGSYYAWLKRPISRRKNEDGMLLQQIRELHRGSRGTYGSPKIFNKLKTQGILCGRNRVVRLMKENGIKAKICKKFRVKSKTIKSSHASENLLNRVFRVEKPNKIWVSDITYIKTRRGWMYLCIFMDLYSRRIVGWSMCRHMRSEMVVEALRMAYRNRRPDEGLVVHSDQGCQYGSTEFRRALAEMKMIQSMSGRGNCWDNACAESFFHLLKTELVQFEDYQDQTDAKMSIFEYLEVFYNRSRIHSALGYLSPAVFEQKKSESLCA